MSPCGDGIYYGLFIRRERREAPGCGALSSHSPWPRWEPGTRLPFAEAGEGVASSCAHTLARTALCGSGPLGPSATRHLLN